MAAWNEELEKTLEKSGNRLVQVKEKEQLAAAATLEPLPFDTELYGFPMARIGFQAAEGDYETARERLAQLLKLIFQACGEERVAHLAARALPSELAWIHALEESGFYMVSGIATYALKLAGYAIPEARAAVKIRPFAAKDLEPLCEISRVSFGDPRDWLDKAHADPNLPKEKSDELYVRWFRNCCNGTRADQVLVAEADGRPVGYIALKLEKGGLESCGVRVGSVELNAVDPAYRRQGIYAALVREGLRWFQPRADWVTIKTQVITLGVHKVWQRLGATLSLIEYYFHKYFGNEK